MSKKRATSTPKKPKAKAAITIWNARQNQEPD